MWENIYKLLLPKLFKRTSQLLLPLSQFAVFRIIDMFMPKDALVRKLILYLRVRIKYPVSLVTDDLLLVHK